MEDIECPGNAKKDKKSHTNKKNLISHGKRRIHPITIGEQVQTSARGNDGEKGKRKPKEKKRSPELGCYSEPITRRQKARWEKKKKKTNKTDGEQWWLLTDKPKNGKKKYLRSVSMGCIQKPGLYQQCHYERDKNALENTLQKHAISHGRWGKRGGLSWGDGRGPIPVHVFCGRIGETNQQ